MSRRDAIRMDDAEVRAFLAEEKTVVVATIGADGWPHLLPLWYVTPQDGFARPDFAGAHPLESHFARPDFAGAHPLENAFARPDFADAHPLGDVTIWAWTYARSQKVRNLERDPRCTLQVEAGTEYGELRGVMLKAECVLHRDVETVAGVGAALAQRYGGGDLAPDVEASMRKQAAKRVGLEFVPRETATWDHRKLGGTY